jgi:hypothetical protein
LLLCASLSVPGPQLLWQDGSQVSWQVSYDAPVACILDKFIEIRFGHLV